ncbi:alpha/beta-hydrolase [Neocallimastix lanati (nom. inval.)]|nr:alpha/beta-hydrolase [Neocallimastix sp. JGI-2020a]
MESIVGKNAIETITSLTNFPLITGASLTSKPFNLTCCGSSGNNNDTGNHLCTTDKLVEITVTTKFKDQEKNKVRHLKKNILGCVNGKEGVFKPLSNFFIQEICEGVVDTRSSPSGEKSVVLKSLSCGGSGDNKDKKEYIIELYNKNRLISTYNVTNYHGNFYTDEHFWNLSWSPDEKKIAYIVEEKKDEKETEGYRAFTYEEDWGEKNDKRRKPQLAILDFNTGEVTVIKTESSVGLVSITKDNKLVFVQFDDKLKYGIIYCSNRFSTAWRCNMDGGNMENIIHQGTRYGKGPLITSDVHPIENVRGLQYDSEGHALYFVSNYVANYPHNSCSRLFKYDLNDKECTLLIDYVDEIGEAYGNAVLKGFPGLFLHQLTAGCCQHYIHPKNPNKKPESFVFLHTSWATRQVILALQQSTGTLIDLTADINLENYEILHITSEFILAKATSQCNPCTLMLGVINYDGQLSVQWSQVSAQDYSEDTKTILNNIDIRTETIKNPDTGGEFDVILLYPKTLPSGLKKSPLIINPHGGPHSLYTFTYSPMLAGFVAFGYTVMLINYTGSLGYGQKKVLELVSKIGELDISDVYAAVEAMKNQIIKFGEAAVEIDTDKIFYYGGSHGGFIGAHMISKYPNLFKACCLRNPVINCGGMLFLSDIPEWSPLELGLPWDLNHPPVVTEDLYQKAFNCSPIKQVDQVVTPLLLLLGEMDRRVPRQDSFYYARLLKSKNKDVEVVLFPGTGHPLDSVEAEKYSFESIINKYSKFI